ncbi:hypothetical protein ACIP98_06265 [Streptomyces sp. NPDC088354]|uniref:hypothetical protein n=1 Tax=unclassified Streptomyces TaxID=2593676 RepID=UPI0029B70EEC|nr:hypothetical protein [Streptomyces sp. MI02-7b]MDX3078550.1 hypothetical protein [Streptomyces sp. MI02-7b]
MSELRTLALGLRQAILDCPDPGLVSLERFPYGSCGDASILLGEYLHENGLGVWTYVSAWENGASHAWIEKNGLRVDITADQFDGVDIPVIIASGGGWHDRFTVDHSAAHGALIAVREEYARAELLAAYDRLTAFIRQGTPRVRA